MQNHDKKFLAQVMAWFFESGVASMYLPLFMTDESISLLAYRVHQKFREHCSGIVTIRTDDDLTVTYKYDTVVGVGDSDNAAIFDAAVNAYKKLGGEEWTKSNFNN